MLKMLVILPLKSGSKSPPRGRRDDGAKRGKLNQCCCYWYQNDQKETLIDMMCMLMMDVTWHCAYFHFVSFQNLCCLFCLPMAEEVRNPVKLFELLELSCFGRPNSNVWREKNGTLLLPVTKPVTVYPYVLCVCVYSYYYMAFLLCFLIYYLSGWRFLSIISVSSHKSKDHTNS